MRLGGGRLLGPRVNIVTVEQRNGEKYKRFGDLDKALPEELFINMTGHTLFCLRQFRSGAFCDLHPIYLS